MISTAYLKYLFRSKRYLLGFLLLVMVLFALMTTGKMAEFGSWLVTVITAFLSIGLPCVVFSYVHNKKSVDTFYSLNVSRRQLLFTGLLFCFLTVFCLQGVGYTILMITSHSYIRNYSLIALLLNGALSSLALIITTTFFYLTANNVFDGVVMIGSYSFLPLAFLIACNMLCSVYIKGLITYNFGYVFGFISPFVNAILLSGRARNVRMTLGPCSVTQTYYISLGMTIFFILVFGYALYRSFISRKVERAETSSGEFLAYPLIINLYALVSLFSINASMDVFRKADVFAEFGISYVLIFAAYVMAHFVYKRKFYFNVKMPLFFAAILLISFLLNGAAAATRGFGIAENYITDDALLRYEIRQYGSSTDPEPSEATTWILKEAEPEKIIPDEENGNLYSAEVTVTVYNSKADRKLLPETIELLEGYRKDSIDAYYDGSSREDGAANMWVYNGYKLSNDGIPTYTFDYDYDIKPLSPEDLMTLSYSPDADITIVIYQYYGYGYATYKLKSGEFVLESIEH